MPIVDFYNVRPGQLKSGDVLVCTVTLHCGELTDDKGRPHFTMYRCPYPNVQIGEEGIPQGDKMPIDMAVMAMSIFPVVIAAGLSPE